MRLGEVKSGAWLFKRELAALSVPKAARLAPSDASVNLLPAAVDVTIELLSVEAFSASTFTA